MKKPSLLRMIPIGIVATALILAAAKAAKDSAFQQFQAHLATNPYSSRDNMVTEKITVSHEGDTLVFHQTLVSGGALASSTTRLKWTIAVSDFVTTKIAKHALPDDGVKVRLTTERDAFRFEGGTTTAGAGDRNLRVIPDSGRSVQLGILFRDSKAADQWVTLHTQLVEELREKLVSDLK